MIEKKILFLLPAFREIGGVEQTLKRYFRKSRHEIYLFEIYKFHLNKYDLEKARFVRVPLSKLFSLHFNLICHFFWQVGLISRIIAYKNDNIVFFINSTILYTGLKALGFKMGLKFARTIVADGEDSQKFVLQQFPRFKSKTVTYAFNPPVDVIDRIKRLSIKKTREIIFVGRWSAEKGVLSFNKASSELLKNVTIITDKPDLVPESVALHANVLFGDDYEFVLKQIASHKYMISLSPREGNSLVLREALHLNTLPFFLSPNNHSKQIYDYLRVCYPSGPQTLFAIISEVVRKNRYSELHRILSADNVTCLDFIEDFDDFE